MFHSDVMNKNGTNFHKSVVTTPKNLQNLQGDSVSHIFAVSMKTTGMEQFLSK